MSRLFEALHKGQPESLELVDIAGPANFEMPVARPAVLEAVEPPREIPQQAASRPILEERSSAAPAPSAGIRTISLRLTAKSPILPFDDLQGRASEQYRIARTRILQHPAAPRIIMVTSPGTQDGKTVSAINLAGALSLRAGFNVLLLDGDFRRPAVHEGLGLPVGPGLSDVLAGAATLEECLVHVEQFPNLYVLPNGSPQSNPAELLDSAQWTTLQTTLKRRFRAIVVDAPPVASVADYDLLLAGADGVVLVVRVDHTNRQTCFDTLRSIPAEKNMGILLNCVQPWLFGRALGYGDTYHAAVR